jgi:membrane fusion protein (multidrug efflux system)
MAEAAAASNGSRAGRARLIALAAAVAALAGLGALWHFSGRESTDDAQVEGHISAVSARVGGPVVEVAVADNQLVEQGALLVRIDPKDYEVALDRAEGDLAEAEAEAQAARTGVPVTSASTASALQSAESDHATAEARLASARARLREAEAKEQKAQHDLERLKGLVAKDEVSRQEYDAVAVAAEAARASLEAARAMVREADQGIASAQAHVTQARTAPQQVAIVKAQAASAEAKVQQARAALERAQLDLDHAAVRAPVAGIVGKKSVELGQIVQPGQPLLAVVPLEDVWIIANFKENQLRDIRPGQRVAISVDAFGRSYAGRVESVAAATGAKFSLLPAENATGNFVKVVQRVPVKIVLEKGQDAEHRLRPGMSVVPTVFTR